MCELFTETEAQAWGGLIVVQSRLFRLIEGELRRRHGLTHAEFEVLLRLEFSPGHRARLQDLGAASLLSPSGTTRAVDRLARAGHVVREGAEEDGRGAYAVLTEKGREHFRTAAREHVELVRREFLSRFTPDEQVVLAGFWARFDDRGHSSVD